MSMILSKRIPARTKTFKASWCKKDFLLCDNTFRKIRSKSRNKMDCCFWCKKDFADGEMMALAHPADGGKNVVLCQDCASKLMGEDS